MMDAERWQRVKAVFDQAIEADPATRGEILRHQCGNDEELLKQVEALLASDEAANSLLDGSGMAAAAAGLAARGTNPLIGRTIGPYRVIREIGRGGMGCVYLAQRADDRFRRRVALKALDPALVDRHTLHRFENERQTLASLDHPNIIKLIDGGTTEDGLPWLVMDYVEGQTLDKYCESHKLDIPERLKLFRTVCAAVHYAHQNLVIHRDLKPSNVMVTAEGVPKLLDFGIAKMLRPEFLPHTVGHTLTNSQPMTPQFASPEQIRSLPVTTASDIYSLGVLLYYLITGRHPYTAGSLLELGRAICETEPEKPSTAAQAARLEVQASPVPRKESGGRDLDMIVLMAMRKEPQRRYASAEHLSEDLRRLLEGHPVMARKDTWTYRAGKLVSRHKPGTALAVAAVVALIVTGLFAYREYRKSERRTRELRQFTQVVLNMDEGLRSGLTTTRAAMLAKAVESLDKLAQEAKGDPDLQRDLVRAYLNMADVQGNVYAANLGNTASAEALYRKALAVAEDLQQAEPKNPANISQAALCNIKLGDIFFGRSDSANALVKYRGAQQASEKLLAADPANREAMQNLTIVWSKMSNAQQQIGDFDGALESYRQCVSQAEKWVAADPSKRASLAFARQQVASLAMKAGEAGTAEPEIRKALEIYHQIYGPSPAPSGQRQIALAYLDLGQAQQLTGKAPEAMVSMQRSLELTERLLGGDTKNQQFQMDFYATLSFVIDVELLNGKRAEAHKHTHQALRFLKPLLDVKDTSPYALFCYVAILTKTPFSDMQDHTGALAYAKRAADATNYSDPEFLHNLARAYANVGDSPHSRETVQKALSLVPPPKPGRPPTELRKKLEKDLAKLSLS